MNYVRKIYSKVCLHVFWEVTKKVSQSNLFTSQLVSLDLFPNALRINILVFSKNSFHINNSVLLQWTLKVCLFWDFPKFKDVFKVLQLILLLEILICCLYDYEMLLGNCSTWNAVESLLTTKIVLIESYLKWYFTYHKNFNSYCHLQRPPRIYPLKNYRLAIGDINPLTFTSKCEHLAQWLSFWKAIVSFGRSIPFEYSSTSIINLHNYFKQLHHYLFFSRHSLSLIFLSYTHSFISSSIFSLTQLLYIPLSITK